MDKLLFPICVQSSTLILGVALKPHNCRWWTAILISYPWKGHFAIDSDMCEALCSHKIAAQQISIAPSGQLSYPWHCRNGHPIFSGNYPILGIARNGRMVFQYFAIACHIIQKNPPIRCKLLKDFTEVFSVHFWMLQCTAVAKSWWMEQWLI